MENKEPRKPSISGLKKVQEKFREQYRKPVPPEVLDSLREKKISEAPPQRKKDERAAKNLNPEKTV